MPRRPEPPKPRTNRSLLGAGYTPWLGARNRVPAPLRGHMHMQQWMRVTYGAVRYLNRYWVPQEVRDAWMLFRGDCSFMSREDSERAAAAAYRAGPELVQALESVLTLCGHGADPNTRQQLLALIDSVDS